MPWNTNKASVMNKYHEKNLNITHFDDSEATTNHTLLFKIHKKYFKLTENAGYKLADFVSPV